MNAHLVEELNLKLGLHEGTPINNGRLLTRNYLCEDNQTQAEQDYRTYGAMDALLTDELNLKLRRKRIEADEVTPNNNNDQLLRTKYFCKVDKTQRKINVVLELSTDENVRETQIPHHYILAIDVSSSMNCTMKSDTRTLLERIKLFASLLIDNTKPRDWLSIVTFNSEASIRLLKTKMDETGKNAAKEAVEKMHASGITNIGEGMFEGLKASAIGDKTLTRDSIILFTDGEANVGLTEAGPLVKKYKEIVQSLGRTSSIPISAMTIGDYKPELLCQISDGLDSDGFYWLQEDSNFEADMCTAMFLRESTCVTDIALNLTCDGVNFHKPEISKEYLQDQQLDNGDVVELNYFVHGLPASMKKNITFTINLPRDYAQIDGEIILRAQIDYLDDQLKKRSFEDRLTLQLLTLKRALIIAEPTAAKDIAEFLSSNDSTAKDIFLNTSAYMVVNSRAVTTWEAAFESLVTVYQNECRVKTVNGLSKISKNLGDESYAVNLISEVVNVCNSLKEVIALIPRKNNNRMAEEFSRDVDTNIQQLESTRAVILSKQTIGTKYGIIKAREISLSKEMPTSSNVFDVKEGDVQPYLPEQIKEKLQPIIKEVSNESIAYSEKRGAYRSRGGTGKFQI